MPGEAESLLSINSMVDEARANDGISRLNIPPEFLHTLDPSDLPPGDLKMKLGSPLILLWNLCPARGLCNGTWMILLWMSRWVLEVKLIGSEHNGQLALIPRITLLPTEGQTGIAFVLKRWQFPVHLAFVLMINRVQGQSVKHIGVDLRTPVFSHGQLYVALSWAIVAKTFKSSYPRKRGVAVRQKTSCTQKFL